MKTSRVDGESMSRAAPSINSKARSRNSAARFASPDARFGVARQEMRQRKLGLDLVDVYGSFEGRDDLARVLKRRDRVFENPEIALRNAEALESP
ncbi:MAG TPA: hypothetical protein VII69_08535 [Candidatus Eremiobacteraceae bacterium]